MRDTSGIDKLTVLVFKDNLVARTFQVPLRWINRLSFLAFLLFATASVGTLLAIKYYRIADQADPERVQDLQMELSDLKEAYRKLENDSLAAKPLTADTTIPSAVPAAASPIPQISPAPISNPVVSGSSLVFSALPAEIQSPPADPNQIPIRIQAPKVQMVGRKLRVSFNILYVKEDGGSQQGRIILLARGPSSLTTYPEGALNPAGSPALLSINKGEYFSVSRFRETRADFGPVVADQTLKEVDILIISQAGQLLFHERLAIAAPAAAAPAAAPPAAAKPSATPTPPSTPSAAPSSPATETESP